MKIVLDKFAVLYLILSAVGFANFIIYMLVGGGQGWWSLIHLGWPFIALFLFFGSLRRNVADCAPRAEGVKLHGRNCKCDSRGR